MLTLTYKDDSKLDYYGSNVKEKEKIIYGYGIRITVILQNIRVRQLGTTERTMFQIMNFPLNAVIKATVAVWATIA